MSGPASGRSPLPATSDYGLVLGAGKLVAIQKGHTSSELKAASFRRISGRAQTRRRLPTLFRNRNSTPKNWTKRRSPTALRRTSPTGNWWVSSTGEWSLDPEHWATEASSRTPDSRVQDRVDEYVKHREYCRPFAPSMLEEAADEYLVNAEPAPYMIKTFDVEPDYLDDMQASSMRGTIRPGHRRSTRTRTSATTISSLPSRSELASRPSSIPHSTTMVSASSGRPAMPSVTSIARGWMYFTSRTTG